MLLAQPLLKAALPHPTPVDSVWGWLGRQTATQDSRRDSTGSFPTHKPPAWPNEVG